MSAFQELIFFSTKELSSFQQKSSALFNKRSQLFLTKELLRSFQLLSVLLKSVQHFSIEAT